LRECFKEEYLLKKQMIVIIQIKKKLFLSVWWEMGRKGWKKKCWKWT